MSPHLSPNACPQSPQKMEPIRPARIGQTRLLGVTTRKCSECTTSWTKHERASRWYVCCTLDDCRSGGGRRHVSDVPIPDLMSAKSAEGWQISSLIVGPTLLEIRDQGSSRLSAGSRAASSRACRSAVAKSPVSRTIETIAINTSRSVGCCRCASSRPAVACPDAPVEFSAMA